MQNLDFVNLKFVTYTQHIPLSFNKHIIRNVYYSMHFN